MLHLLCNKKGMGLIEVVIAMFITSVAVMALLSLQDNGWRAMARSDLLGRASEILYKTLEDNEARIMNPCNTVVVGAQAPATIRVSGQTAAISGDMIYTVNTTIAAGVNTNSCVVTVSVTWANNATGISESINVTRQELYRFPAGCANAAGIGA